MPERPPAPADASAGPRRAGRRPSTPPDARQAAAQLFAGPGEMRARCRAFDWAATPLGPVTAWGSALRTIARTVLGTRQPMFLFWGAEHVQLYNDAYRPSLGESRGTPNDRHPRALGARGHEFWTEIWDTIGPQIAQVMAGGEATWHEDQYLPIWRNGRMEDVWWTYSYSPVPDDGGVGGVLVTCQETTGRVHAEAALRGSEERLRLAVDATNLGVFDWDLTTDRIVVNPTFRAIFGLPPGQTVIGAVMLDTVVHPDDRALVTARLAEALDPAGPGRYQFEHRAVTPAGDVRWLHTVGQVHFAGPDRETSADRRAVRVVGNYLDVTARKQAEVEREALLAREHAARSEAAEQLRLLEAVYGDTPVGLAVLDRDLRYVRVNARLAEMNGRSVDAHLGCTLREVVPDLADAAAAALGRILATREPLRDVKFVGTTPAAPGVERARVEQWVPLFDAAGAIVGVHVVAEEVTGQRRAERELRAAAEAIPQLVWITTPDGYHEYYNARWYAYTGMSRPPGGRFDPAIDEEGWHWKHYLHPDDYAATVARWARCLATGEPYEIEYRFREAVTGTYRWFLGRALPLRDEAGRITRWFGTGTDIHEQRVARETAERARQEAEAARAEAVQANQAKSLFLATMSHELRTPLNAIQGHVQLLAMELHGPVTEAQRAALERVERAQRHLLGLINNVLNFAKLEAGRVEYAVEAVDLRAVLAHVVPMIEPQLATKRHTYDVVLPDGPCLVWADADKLGQVLLNLLSNAIKFTPSGGHVTVAHRTRAGTPDVVHVQVTDTGLGIPRDKQDAVFEPFVQVHASASAHAGRQEGTGLGLAISRELARGMGGDLRVRSKDGHGSTFTVTLRRVTAADGTPLDRRARDERRDDGDRRSGGDRRDGDPV